MNNKYLIKFLIVIYKVRNKLVELFCKQLKRTILNTYQLNNDSLKVPS